MKRSIRVVDAVAAAVAAEGGVFRGFAVQVSGEGGESVRERVQREEGERADEKGGVHCGEGCGAYGSNLPV